MRHLTRHLMRHRMYLQPVALRPSEPKTQNPKPLFCHARNPLSGIHTLLSCPKSPVGHPCFNLPGFPTKKIGNDSLFCHNLSGHACPKSPVGHPRPSVMPARYVPEIFCRGTTAGMTFFDIIQTYDFR